jgi:site-specific DNA recombinase
VQTKPQFPYRGLLVCGRCGCHLTAAIAKRKYVYYRCTGARGGCTPTCVRQDRLGEQLASVVGGVRLTAEQVAALLQAMHDRRQERETERKRRLQRLGERLEKIAH